MSFFTERAETEPYTARVVRTVLRGDCANLPQKCRKGGTFLPYNYLVGMLYTQVFQELYYLADRKFNGRLPRHVRVLMDEFANIALPDSFEKILATCRSREISINIIIQNIAQLKALFKDSYENVIGNCDFFLYLGGNEQATHKYVSELLGKQTIDTRSSSKSRGRNGSYSISRQQAGRELKTPDEVRLVNEKEAILFIRGERAVFDRKYNINKHPNKKWTTIGGGDSYERKPALNYALEDFLTPKNLDDIEFIEWEELENEEKRNEQGRAGESAAG